MVAVAPLAPVRPEHVDELRTLEKIICCYHGFQLILALYNDPPDYRNRLIDYLNGLVDQADRVDTRTCADFLEFEQRLASACAASELVHVVGLDAWLREKEGEKRLQGFNLHRETLAVSCQKPVVLWLPVHLASQFALQAPDVWEWRRAVLDFSVEGGISPESLLETLDWFAGKRQLTVESLTKACNGLFISNDWKHAHFNAGVILIQDFEYSGWTIEALAYSLKLYHRAIAAGVNAYPQAKFDIALAYLILGKALLKDGAADQAISLLKDAQQRFENIEHIPTATSNAVLALKEQGKSLFKLGQHEQAMLVYKESISRAEKLGERNLIAAAKMEFGAVLFYQKEYNEALIILEEARQEFLELGDMHNLARVWTLTGMVYAETVRYEEAKNAYQESIFIEERLGDIGIQATALGELGTLYSRLNRLEDAVASYRQSADKFAEIGDLSREGVIRSNVALHLTKLGLTTEARNQIFQTIKKEEPFGYAAKPWYAWNILRAIETADNQMQAAEEARQKALELFLAYRRDGGENNKHSGRVCKAIGEALQASNKTGARRFLRHNRHNPSWMREGNPEPLLDALTKIIVGNRDASIADNPDLTYDQAAEIILLLETLRSAE